MSGRKLMSGIGILVTISEYIRVSVNQMFGVFCEQLTLLFYLCQLSYLIKCHLWFLSYPVKQQVNLQICKQGTQILAEEFLHFNSIEGLNISFHILEPTLDREGRARPFSAHLLTSSSRFLDASFSFEVSKNDERKE